LRDPGETGIGLFIYSGDCETGDPQPSAEGLAEWIPYERIVTGGAPLTLPVVEDLPVLLAKIHPMQRGDPPFSARSYYDEDGMLVMAFA